MMIPFLEVVRYTINEVLKKHDVPAIDQRIGVIKVKPENSTDEEMPKPSTSMSSTLIKLTSRLMLPISSVIFTLVFWVVGLIKSLSLGGDHDSDMSDCLTMNLN